LRIGEVEQLQWIDLRLAGDGLGMFHIRRGGSNGTTKDKEERFVPIHPRIGPLIRALPRRQAEVFPGIKERSLLIRIKQLCRKLGFLAPERYKLHSFRHHFASLCANHQVAYRKALAWLGHSSSEILSLYYHLHDDDSQHAMLALAAGAELSGPARAGIFENKGSFGAIGESKIEKLLQVQEFQDFANCLVDESERKGFEPLVPFPVLRFSRPPP
jgi:integrase